MTVRVHPFPSRTRQLSSLVPTILGWKRPGKIGRCQHKQKRHGFTPCLFCLLWILFIYQHRAPANLITELNCGNMHRRCIFEPWPYILRSALATRHGKRPGKIGDCRRLTFSIFRAADCRPYGHLLRWCKATASGTGKIGRCQHRNRPHGFPCGLFFYLQLRVFSAASSAETTENGAKRPE